MDIRPIGVFDSGLGGLTAVKELLSILPQEDIVYFGDTGRVPYGSRGNEVITRYAGQDVSFLLGQQVKAVLCACGTVSSVAGGMLAEHSPVPFFEVVSPTAAAACAATKNERIGVIATKATIASGMFTQKINSLLPTAQVFARACPLFVPLAEEGHIAIDDPITTPAVELYLNQLKKNNIDTLILGCTHYPILAPIIGNFFDGKVTLIDSGREAARALKLRLETDGLLTDATTPGSLRYYVSDSTQSFAQVAEIFLGTPVRQDVEKIDIAALEALPIPQQL
ncbi:MAG: glutamate racemase [Angelakisella sp.]|nr:glutamate racemase [Angelakisella sp.]